MLLRGMVAAIVLTTGILLSARFVMETTSVALNDGETDGHSTFAIAPITLGNPAAAAALQIHHPNFVTGTADAGDQAPLFARTLTADRGDTLSNMLIQAGISGQETDAAIAELRKYFNPGHLRQGQAVTVNFQADGQALVNSGSAVSGYFMGLSLLPDPENRVVVARDVDGDFKSEIVKRDLKRQMARAENTITYSLSQAGTNVRVPNAVLAEIIRLYSWDVDFQRDIRKGDAFEVMYERFVDRQGETAHTGDILFASLTLSGKRHAVYRHTTKDGETDYFDEHGQSAKKALMRTPIDGARLSSGFGKRKHPILGYNKMHKGLDFAAPSGTPIYAAGNGMVEHAGTKGAYGNYVRIRHNSEYATAYAHMSKIKTKKGQRVKQGQIIGYVGTTGRSTGPHLHYEVLRGNQQVNPLRVAMPSGRKLKGAELALFQNVRTELMGQYAAADTGLELASGN